MATPEGVDPRSDAGGRGLAVRRRPDRPAAAVAVLLALVILLGVLGDGVRERRSRRARPWPASSLVCSSSSSPTTSCSRRWRRGARPGKRWTGLRVVKIGGAPGRLPRQRPAQPAAHRRRPARVLPRRHPHRAVHQEQPAPRRPGRRHHRGPRAQAGDRPCAGGRRRPPTEDIALYDVSAVSAEELATVRRFLDRRPTLAPEARDRLAMEMATRLGPKVVGPPRQWDAGGVPRVPGGGQGGEG